MKLQRHNVGGVQSLGQVDINAPGRKWQAKTQAKTSMTNAFYEGSNQLSTVFKAQDDAGGELLLQQRLLADGVHHARSLSYLENTPNLDLANGKDIPDDIRTYAMQWAVDNPDANGNAPQNVKTHEIIDGYMQSEYRSTIDASVNALAESGHAADYVKAIDGSVIEGTAKTLKIQLTQRQEDLKAQADTQFAAAVQVNDELSAELIAANNVKIGAWTPQVAAEKLAKLGPQLDYNNVNEAIMESETQEDLDIAMSALDLSRVLPDKRPALMNKAREQQKYFTTLLTGEQSRKYETGTAMLVEGLMTEEWIISNARAHKISGGQANTLRNALNKAEPRVTDPKVLNDMNIMIAQIKYGNGLEETTVTQRARRARQELTRQITGINPDGTTFQPTMRGEDMLKMGQEIDKIVNESQGKGGQQYKIATDQIKKLTGYSDQFEKAFEGPYPAGVAHTEFVNALQDYMNYMGAEADPREFVAANQAKYTAEIYTKQHLERMAIQYPQYDVGWQVEDMQPYVVMTMAAADFASGALSYEDLQNIRRSLAYLSVSPDAYNKYQADSVEQTAIDVTSPEATGLGQ